MFTSDDHQLMYSDSRNEHIRLLKHPIDIEVSQLHDTIRFFHGDGPAACEMVSKTMGDTCAGYAHQMLILVMILLTCSLHLKGCVQRIM